MGALTPFIGILYSALEDANQEATGFILASSKNMEASRVAKGQKVYAPLGDVAEPIEIVPGHTAPEVTEENRADIAEITIEHEKAVRIKLTGNETLGLDASGNYDRVTKAMFADAIRKLNNQIEQYMAKKVIAGASRAVGDGTTPIFDTAGELTDLANLGRILNDNGCPDDGRNFVMSNDVLAKLQGKNNILNNANKLGSDDFIRYGMTAPVLGFRLWRSGGLKLHDNSATSTGNGYTLTDAFETGTTDVEVDTGTGVIAAGDAVTINGDTYMVKEGIDAPGIIKLSRPGLVKAGADGNAVTLINKFNPCVAFHTDAVHLATRAPAVPKFGDLAIDRFLLASEKTGLVYDVAIYPEYKQIVMEISIAYGASVMNAENVAVLLGK